MIPFENFADASTTAHMLQGAAFILLGAAETVKLQNPDSSVRRWAALAFIISGALSLAAVFYYLGGPLTEDLKFSLGLKPGLYFLPAFSFILLSAGVAFFMEDFSKSAVWEGVSLLLLLSLVTLHLFFHTRVNPAQSAAVLASHTTLAIPLFAALALKLINKKIKSRKISLVFPILILISGFQLAMYKENPETFSYRTVTVSSEADNSKSDIKKPFKNEKTADKKSAPERSVGKTKK